MAKIKRNKVSRNPSRRSMSVDVSFKELLEQNERALRLLAKIFGK